MTDRNVKLILAPMAGVTDSAFRTLCMAHGADFAVSEMISAKAMWYGDRKTKELAFFREEERPISLQIFGSDPKIMAFAAKKLEEDFHPDGIDINMGCPVPKIVKSGDGSALMKNPELVYEIVSAVTEAVKIPVTVKIRKGFTDNDANAPEIAQMAEKGGASAVAVHGKTRSQMYAPPVDLDVIREVKRAVKIPVFGNGDIKNAADAEKMLEYTGCDGLMIGRAAMGAPYIFKEIKAGLRGEKISKPSGEEICEMLCRQAEMSFKDKGVHAACEMRKHLLWYIKGFRGAAGMREAASRVSTMEDILAIAKKIAKELG